MTMHPKGYKVIPEYLKQKRKENKMTQKDLAHIAGVGLRFIRDLEQGKQTTRMDKVNQVLKVFGAGLVPMDLRKSRS